jgi:hypothetical protein
MTTELVKASSGGIQAPSGTAILPELVGRAGGAARFAWEEFFFAEHHNPHTQRAYQSAVRRFLSWCEEEGVEPLSARRRAACAAVSRKGRQEWESGADRRAATHFVVDPKRYKSSGSLGFCPFNGLPASAVFSSFQAATNTLRL